ncbi:hypothetical protein ACI65C_004056 [Semiaphis heraclei]
MLRAAEYHTPILSPNCEKNNEEYDPHQISISFPALEEMDDVATINKTSTPAPVLKGHNEDEDHAIHHTSMSSSDFEEVSEDYNSEEMLFIPKSKCSLCNAGNPPKAGANKCFICKKPVHSFLTCSTHKPGTENERLCTVSYCDNNKYSEMFDISEKSDFIKFICNILNYGITSTSYTNRADLIINNLNVEIKQMEYDTTLVVCASTIGHVIDILMEKYPSAKAISDCTVCKYKTERKIMHLTFQMNYDDNISTMQNFLDERLVNDFLNCGHNGCRGLKTVTTSISEMHIFIDILLWEGEDAVSSNRSSEAATIIKIKLCDIPQIIKVKSAVYELRAKLFADDFNFWCKSRNLKTIQHFLQDTAKWSTLTDFKISMHHFLQQERSKAHQHPFK